MDTPDWDMCFERLLSRCEQAIREFLAEHQHETLAFLAINVDYLEGFFGFCFDTLANSRQVAEQDYQNAIQTRRELIGHMRGWENARSYLLNNSVRDYNDDVGLFAYLNYREYVIASIGHYYSDETLGTEPDPEGHVIRLCWRVLDNIYLRNPFQLARTSSPFRLGFFFQESGLRMMVTHLLNWQQRKEGHAPMR